MYNIIEKLFFLFTFYHTSFIQLFADHTRFLNSEPSHFRDKDLTSHLEGKLSSEETTECLFVVFARDSNATGTVRLPPRARLLVVPGACFAALPWRGTTFAPFPRLRPPTALSPPRFRRIWIGPDNIAVGTTPRLHHRHDIRGRISYIPLFPSFRIHL